MYLKNQTRWLVIDLPDELLAQTFTYLHWREIVENLSVVCKQFHFIITQQADESNSLWKFLSLNRWKVWPQLNNILNVEDKLRFERSSREWLQLLDHRSQSLRDAITPLIIQEQVMSDDVLQSIDDKIEAMYSIVYNNHHKGPILWLNLFVERSLKDMRVLRLLNKTMWNNKLELEVIAECVNMGMDVFEHLTDEYRRSDNLTFQYFAKKVLQKIHAKNVYREWVELLEVCESQHCKMIHGAILLAKLRNMSLSVVDSIFEPLDCIVQNVIQHAKAANVDISYEHQQLFDIVNIELFEKAKFSGDVDNYYAIENCFLDTAIKNKTGIPITLCAIYQYICFKAFNIDLVPIGAPAHFILKWEKGSRFIDVFHGGKVMTQSLCVENLLHFLSNYPDADVVINESLKKRTSNRDVYIRMLANIVGYSTRQYGVIRDEELIEYLGVSLLLDQHYYMHRILRLEKVLNYPDMLDLVNIDFEFIQNNMDLIGRYYDANAIRRLLNKVEAIVERTRIQLENEPDRPEQVRRTSKDAETVKYKVGQIMHHKKHNYRGVIFGWDRTCMMSDQWNTQMGVTQTQKEKPFYHVLVHYDDRPNQTTYVATDNIQILEEMSDGIENDEIGRYFIGRENNRYIPNHYTRYQYPDDF